MPIPMPKRESCFPGRTLWPISFLDSTLAETAGDNHAIYIIKCLLNPHHFPLAFPSEPIYVYLYIVGYAAVAKGLGHAQVGIVELHVLAHQGYV